MAHQLTYGLTAGASGGRTLNHYEPAVWWEDANVEQKQRGRALVQDLVTQATASGGATQQVGLACWVGGVQFAAEYDL